MLTILKFCINAVWINFIYLFQVKIYICSFKRPIVIKRIIYYNPEIRNNDVLLPNENNNSRSLII